ncbi:tetratricopeptide repeat protein [Luteolibacter arcticus]|uniref:Tetratricopeptide repeat protein n=1 Tax=Luteolibacter arcticus TaxID=1581411 RepID=A0ABT3GE90_9BACT|nr:tetratricopeptide repeat protein [Luteolibacter arcticus]MCW1921889.1 tetratricopeptide repeat protein [Luteolibacter arcticus]
MLFLAALLMLVCFLAWPAMTSEPLVDDYSTLQHVAKFKDWTDAFKPDAFQYLRPFKNLAFYLFHLHGIPSIEAWHMVPLGAYLIATVAVFALLRRISCSRIAACLGTAAWALSPTNTSTVVWMSCLHISLAVIFVALFLIAYDRSRESGRWISFGLSLILLFLALASYETAIFAVALVVALDWIRKRPLFKKESLIRYACLGGVTLAFLLLRQQGGSTLNSRTINLGFAPDMPAWQFTVAAPWFLWRHFSMWFAPFGRIEFCSTFVWGKSATPLDLAGGWIFLALLVAAVFLTARRLPLFAFGLVWFLLASFPTSNLIPLGTGPIEDYYIVLPGVGLAVCIAGLAEAILQHRKATDTEPRKLRPSPALLGAASLLCLLKLAGVPWFHHQAGLWRDPLLLYLQGKDTRTGQYLCKTFAANICFSRGQFAEAKELAADARRDAPWFHSASMTLAEVAVKEGDYAGALQITGEAIEKIPPGSRQLNRALVIQGKSHFYAGHLDRARESILTILSNSTAPMHFEATWLLAAIYQKQGNPEKAGQTLAKSLALHPDAKAIIDAALESLRAGQPISLEES